MTTLIEAKRVTLAGLHRAKQPMRNSLDGMLSVGIAKMLELHNRFGGCGFVNRQPFYGKTGVGLQQFENKQRQKK